MYIVRRGKVRVVESCIAPRLKAGRAKKNLVAIIALTKMTPQYISLMKSVAACPKVKDLLRGPRGVVEEILEKRREVLGGTGLGAMGKGVSEGADTYCAFRFVGRIVDEGASFVVVDVAE